MKIWMVEWSDEEMHFNHGCFKTQEEGEVYKQFLIDNEPTKRGRDIVATQLFVVRYTVGEPKTIGA